MKRLPVHYPSNDDVPYRAHFAPQYQSVYVAFNPFIRVLDQPKPNYTQIRWDEFMRATWAKGLSVEVSWSEVCELCDFATARRLNRALRTAISPLRLRPELAHPEDTKLLLERCEAHSIELPDEGNPSPSLRIRMAQLLDDLGHGEVWTALSFGLEPKRVPISALHEQKLAAAACIHTLDGSLHAEIYIDYQYMLIAQSAQSFARADPSRYLEGFAADATTTDFWGIGPAADD